MRNLPLTSLAFSVALMSSVALIAPCAAADSAQAGSSASGITVTLSSYAIAPAQLELQHGTAYVLHFVNASGKSHNFSAPELFAASTIAPADRAKIERGAVEVDGGSSVDIALTPLTPGNYKVECSHFLHAAFGMRSTATVR
jgi:plastocyanin